VAVVLLAKILSYPLERAIATAGLPQSFFGVVIAAVLLLPEGIAALKAAHLNRLLGPDAGKHGSSVANTVRQYADTRDGTNDRPSGRGSPRDFHCVHSVGGSPMKAPIQGSANTITLKSKVDR